MPQTFSKKAFELYLTHFGGEKPDNALLASVIAELGLAERAAYSGEEMLAIEKGLAARIQQELATLPVPGAQRYAALMGQAKAFYDRHGQPEAES